MIAVYNYKGGTGKTAISLNYALQTHSGIVTNDHRSPLERVIGKENVIKAPLGKAIPIPKKNNIVFDLGGYVDARVIPVLKKVDVIIIPTLATPADIQITIQCLKDVEKYCKKRIVVANRLKGGKKGKAELQKVTAPIEQFFPTVPVLPLKETTGLVNLYDSKASLEQVGENNPLMKHAYSQAITEFKKIISFI